MTCLLLRLAGPMQSWGHQSRFSDRDTGREPTRSGVVGLLCAALGVDRDAPIPDDLRIERLRMGVRVDREGVPARDYQTAGGGTLPGGQPYGVIKADGTSCKSVETASKFTVISPRHYLADAEFLVALEPHDPASGLPLPDDAARPILEAWRAALAAPVWPLFLGRKSFTPAFPMDLGLREAPLREALRSEPFHMRSRYEDLARDGLRLVLERDPRIPPDKSPEGHARRDVPESFALGDRRYSIRFVTHEFLPAAEVTVIPAPAHPEREFPRCTSPA